MMAPTICLPPIILDQSFPRNEDELRLVAIALGELYSFVSEGKKGYLLVTDVLKDIALAFDWEQLSYPLMREIYTQIQVLVLQPHERIFSVDVSSVKNYRPHPFPTGSNGQGLIEFWADELGKLLVVHDENGEERGFYIGVACAHAFAGEEVQSSYANPAGERVFPFVGPENCQDVLDDAFKWIIPNMYKQCRVTVNDVRTPSKYRLIGAVALEHGGNHEKLIFDNGAWPFTDNNEFIPTDGLNQLSQITGYPRDVIKVAFATGTMPKKVFRLEKYCL